jgi:hypothetical protein
MEQIADTLNAKILDTRCSEREEKRNYMRKLLLLVLSSCVGIALEYYLEYYSLEYYY